MSWATFKESLMGGTRLYCMIALILAGAAFLTLSMGYIGLPRHLAEWIATLGLSKFALILALTAFYVVLGCFLDGISMVVLTMGVIMPTVQKAGIDPLWFGIFIVIVVEMAQVTPPVGFNLFVLQGMTKREIGTIARAAFPFFLLMVGMVVLLYAFPQLVDLPAAADEALARERRGAEAANWRQQVAHFRPPRAARRRPSWPGLRKACARPLADVAVAAGTRTAMADLSTPLSWKAQPGPARAAGAAPAAPPSTPQGKGQPRRLPLADAALRELSRRRPSRPRRCRARSSSAPS